MLHIVVFFMIIVGLPAALASSAELREGGGGLLIGLRAGYILSFCGEVIPQSIASLEKIELGGMERWVLLRGKDASSPVLLWLHGGPGAAQMPVARHFNGELEEEFLVVHWDQRGAGKSNPRNFDESTMTLEQFLGDAHQLTRYLKESFGREKIYLPGHSWGSQIGIKLVQVYPEDYHAYIGVSQVVDTLRSQKIAHTWLLSQIEEKGGRKDKRKLEELGPPPYADHEKFVMFIHMVSAHGGDFGTHLFVKETFTLSLL